MHPIKFAIRFTRCSLYAFFRGHRKSSRHRRSVGWFHERPAPSSAENCVASPSIMKGPLIMKVAEGVPSGGITIFHAYCLTTERLQAPFCLPRYQPPSLDTFSSHRPFLCVNSPPSCRRRDVRCSVIRIAMNLFPRNITSLYIEKRCSNHKIRTWLIC